MKKIHKLLLVTLVMGFALPSYAKCRLPVEKNDEFSGEKIRSTRNVTLYSNIFTSRGLKATMLSEGGKTTFILEYMAPGLLNKNVPKGSIVMIKTKDKSIIKLKANERVEPEQHKRLVENINVHEGGNSLYGSSHTNDLSYTKYSIKYDVDAESLKKFSESPISALRFKVVKEETFKLNNHHSNIFKKAAKCLVK